MYDFSKYDFNYYATAISAGAIGTMITHTSMTPFDVVKTRIQLEPSKYSENPLATARKLGAEGVPLFTGGAATALGYLGQGAGKFGGVEIIKIQLARYLGDEAAYKNRVACTLLASAIAETVTDIVWLCPFEAIRIRQVSNPTLGMGATAKQVLQTEGVAGFYAGLGPILLKQVPYTMAKFSVQDVLREKVCPLFGIKNVEEIHNASLAKQTGVAATSGFGAGVAAALVSHPADTMLTLMNKGDPALDKNASFIKKATFFAKQRGIGNIFTGALFTRFLHVGLLTAGQFIVFDIGLAALGFEKFHFVHPQEPTRLQKRASLAV